MIENPTQRPSAAWTAGAIGLVLVAYLAVFGEATVYAVQILLDPTLEARNQFASDGERLNVALYYQGIAVAVTAVAVVVALRGLRLSGAELGLRRVSPGFPFGVLGAVAAAYLAMQVGTIAESITNAALPAWTEALAASQVAVAPPTGGWESQLTEVVRGVGAAVSEEVLVLALPIAIAMRLGWSTPVLLAVLVTLRLPYHLWHGPAAIALAVGWTLVALWVYRRVGSVWPFVVAHVATYLLAGVYPVWLKVAVGAVSVALIVLGIVTVVRARRADQAVAPAGG